MSISTSPSSVLHTARRATVANDVISETGPMPGMSQRAKLIARSLGFVSVGAWIAATDSSLLGAAAVALPIWIGSELALARRRSARRALRVERFALDRPLAINALSLRSIEHAGRQHPTGLGRDSHPFAA